MKRWEPASGRLRFRTIFLAAGMPRVEEGEVEEGEVEEKGPRSPEKDSRIETEEAVISLARAVFAEGGDIAMIEDPVLSPLVTMVAGEYLVPQAAEEMGRDREREERKGWRPVSLFRPARDEMHREVDHMASLGHATVLPIQGPPWEDSRDQIEDCLFRARPDAMVCIGGDEEVDQQCQIFLERLRKEPLFVLAETGGTAARWGERFQRDSDRVIVFDRHVLDELRRRDSEMRSRREEPEEPEPRFTPYALIVQILIRSLFG